MNLSFEMWIEIQLYRRFTAIGGLPQTYTMGAINTPPGSVDFIAFFAHVEIGHCIGLPDFSRGQLDVKQLHLTNGFFKTYGYTPGRKVLYNTITQEIREAV